jgi:hypothetical protein
VLVLIDELETGDGRGTAERLDGRAFMSIMQHFHAGQGPDTKYEWCPQGLDSAQHDLSSIGVVRCAVGGEQPYEVWIYHIQAYSGKDGKLFATRVRNDIFRLVYLEDRLSHDECEEVYMLWNCHAKHVLQTKRVGKHKWVVPRQEFFECLTMVNAGHPGALKGMLLGMCQSGDKRVVGVLSAAMALTSGLEHTVVVGHADPTGIGEEQGLVAAMALQAVVNLTYGRRSWSDYWGETSTTRDGQYVGLTVWSPTGRHDVPIPARLLTDCMRASKVGNTKHDTCTVIGKGLRIETTVVQLMSK